MAPPAPDTRTRILATAETLFAERGVDGVSLVEIGRAAGQRNRGAAQYHFRDKEGLIRAIFSRHAARIAQARHAMLDAVEASPSSTLRDVMDALVLPVADRLDDPDGGRAFLLINAELLGHPTYDLVHERATAGVTGSDRLMRAALRRIDVPRAERASRQMLVTSLLVHGLADYVRAGDAAPPQRRFVSSLVDAVTRILEGPPSPAGRARSKVRDPKRP